MARIKLTKSAVDAAQPQAQDVELRDTLVPGFLCKITPAGRKVFIVSADGKLTHPADRKLTHLGRGWRPLGGRLDVDPGGSSGSEGVGPSGQRGA